MPSSFVARFRKRGLILFAATSLVWTLVPVSAQAGAIADRDWKRYFEGCVPALSEVSKQSEREVATMCACQEEAAARLGDQEAYDALSRGDFRSLPDSARGPLNAFYQELCTSADGRRDTPSDPELLKRVDEWIDAQG